MTRSGKRTNERKSLLKEYNAYIFDMDGTVLDTLRDLGDAMNWAMKKHGHPGDFDSRTVGAWP